jgi:GNAT superfamily N-acetyltransferase
LWIPARHAHIRRLWRSDLPAFKAHLHRLDQDTLYNRFGGFASGAFLDDYAETCLRDGSVIYGYFDQDLIHGAGELRWAPGTAEAEAALSVEKDWRRQGIGSELFAHVIRAARNRSIKSLSILCLPNNQNMLALARKFEAVLRFESDEITGCLIARELSPLSVWSEYVEDGFGFAASLFDAQKHFWKHYFDHKAGVLHP